jgi:hypothetical protein
MYAYINVLASSSLRKLQTPYICASQQIMLWFVSHYIQQVWGDLNGATGFYSRLQSNPTDPSAVSA